MSICVTLICVTSAAPLKPTSNETSLLDMWVSYLPAGLLSGYCLDHEQDVT